MVGGEGGGVWRFKKAVPINYMACHLFGKETLGNIYMVTGVYIYTGVYMVT